MSNDKFAVSAADGITVILPTYERPAALRTCLLALAASCHENYEVIVVDQSPCVCSADVVASAGDPRIRYRRLSTKGKARALNFALQESRNESIAMLDDDIEVKPSWLQDGMTLLHEHPSVALVFGAVRAKPHDRSETFIPEFLPKHARTLTSPTALRLPGTGMGANAFVRKSDAWLVGGWNENLGPGSEGRSGDDWDLAYRLLRRRRPVLVTPSLEVAHSGARRYADGTARQLIENNFHGLGVGLGGYVRQGDIDAGIVLASTLSRSAFTVAAKIATGRAPTGFRALSAMVGGLKKAWI